MVGPQDLLVGLALALFFVGAKRLPEIARSLGTSLREFQQAAESADEPEAAPPAPADSAEPGRPPTPPCASCGSLLDAGWAYCPRCATSRGP
jgi:TatA/E family protein of Tat protein translocase